MRDEMGDPSQSNRFFQWVLEGLCQCFCVGVEVGSLENPNAVFPGCMVEKEVYWREGSPAEQEVGMCPHGQCGNQADQCVINWIEIFYSMSGPCPPELRSP